MRLLIALGGAAGALGRTGVGLALGDHVAAATLLVNLTGVFALGVLLARPRPERVAAAVGTGFLGAWTTFSALAVTPVLELGVVRAGSYISLTIVGGLWLYRLGRRVGGAPVHTTAVTA